MKKIIALAVASAFVAPAMAAEITVGGEIEYRYVVGDTNVGGLANVAGAAENKSAFSHNDNLIFVQGVEEVNGITITGKMNVIDDTDGDANLEQDGTSLTLSGAFGTVAIGDVSGGMDAFGDYTDVAPSGGGFTLDGGDHAMSYTLPTLVEGLTITASMSPEKAGDNAGDGTSVKADASGYGLQYAVGPMAAYWAQEKVGDAAEATAYGVKLSFSGLTVAAETGKEKDGQTAGEKSDISSTVTRGTDELTHTGMSITYKLGDVLVGAERQQLKERGQDDLNKQTVMFVEYNLGSNVDIYVSHVQQEATSQALDSASAAYDKAPTTNTRIGVEYNF